MDNFEFEKNLVIIGNQERSIGSVVATVQAVTQDKRFKRRMGILVDHRGSEESMTIGEVERRIMFVADVSRHLKCRCAVVVGQYHIALEQIAGGFAESKGVKLKVFGDDVEARVWLREGTRHPAKNR